MLKFLLRVILAIALLLFCASIFRGALYRAVVHYEMLRERPVPFAGPIDGARTAARDLEDMIDAALDTTARLLQFTMGSASSDPAVLLRGGDANCTGYAAVFASLVRNELDRVHRGQHYRVEQLIAQLHIGDRNLHDAFRSPFWRDHDIVRIMDLRDGSVTYIDPTLYDAVGIGRVTGQ